MSNYAPSWLWSNWIPNGMLTLLGGATDGESTAFALDLARRVVQGSEWPDGYPSLHLPKPVIYLDATPDPSTTSEIIREYDLGVV